MSEELVIQMSQLHEEAESEGDSTIIETKADTEVKKKVGKNMIAVNHPTALILSHSRRQK